MTQQLLWLNPLAPVPLTFLAELRPGTVLVEGGSDDLVDLIARALPSADIRRVDVGAVYVGPTCDLVIRTGARAPHAALARSSPARRRAVIPELASGFLRALLPDDQLPQGALG